eukprot:Phypoly_transcript_06971.p1 GENE.Phypoly_transcript_06971~~Phypoly_transcript_06971.p1  ORF type:complete len:481 (+),score=75.82 Phypoly_transcript_06971:254-1696(+)
MGGKAKDENITEVFVMLPLDSINITNPTEINDLTSMQSLLKKAKKIGLKGVMVDVWWGLVERDGEGKYEWGGYVQLLEEIKKNGLRLEAIMSFHACGNGPGDNVFIPLPKWVTKIGESNSDIYYKDMNGNACPESLSLGVDNELVGSRTGLEIYYDFMKSFQSATQPYILDGTLVKVSVGCGACGELRYPAYNEQFGWKYPGVGSFQCFDKYMLQNWAKHTANVSIDIDINLDLRKSLAECGPSNALPRDTRFFEDDGAWNSIAGHTFLDWYSKELINHGDRMLKAARRVFDTSSTVELAIKIPGIHWQYNTLSHSAELTTGFYNTAVRDGYAEIAQMCARHKAQLNFTCMEMTDVKTNAEAKNAASSPQTLALQVIAAASKANISVVGENATSPIDPQGYAQMIRFANIATRHDPSFLRPSPMASITILRASDSLFSDPHFSCFVHQMHKERQWGKTWWLSSLGLVGLGLGIALWKYKN